jgi:hypothetical protein
LASKLPLGTQALRLLILKAWLPSGHSTELSARELYSAAARRFRLLRAPRPLTFTCGVNVPTTLSSSSAMAGFTRQTLVV